MPLPHPHGIKEGLSTGKSLWIEKWSLGGAREIFFFSCFPREECGDDRRDIELHKVSTQC